jgi:uncharacterized protein with von Willebrand factor type A (vWA) domain
VTGLFGAEDLAGTLGNLPASVADWGGGTRIGHCLDVFMRRYAGRLLSGKTVVIIYSDGWDRGETERLAENMARIRRKAYRVLWLNPLAGKSGYEPVCRGMRAALPHIDHLLPAAHLYDFQRTETLLYRMLRP